MKKAATHSRLFVLEKYMVVLSQAPKGMFNFKKESGMPSCAQRKKQKKQASNRRFLAATRLKLIAALERRSPQAQAPETRPFSPPEPIILGEDIGKLADLGLDERAVSYLRKGGIRLVREVPEKGEAKIRGIYGMKTHFPQLKQILRSYGAEIPA